MLKHLAIIMDGNGRWAKRRLLPVEIGHRAGAKKIEELLPVIANSEVKHLTLFAFSSENWKREKREVNNLLYLLGYYLDEFVPKLNEYGCKLKIIGNLSMISKKLQYKIKETEKETASNDKLNLYIAFSYGGREEILHACSKLSQEGANEADFTEENLRKFFYAPDMPDIDLLIRSGGEKRISNFAIWQAAYAEIFFSDKYWPDFSEQDLKEAMEDYKKRERRFGSRR